MDFKLHTHVTDDKKSYWRNKMAECYVCGKKKVSGNHVSHSHKKTKRVFKPNLQRIRVQTEKGPRRRYVCTRCIRSGAVKKAI